MAQTKHFNKPVPMTIYILHDGALFQWLLQPVYFQNDSDFDAAQPVNQ